MLAWLHKDTKRTRAGTESDDDRTLRRPSNTVEPENAGAGHRANCPNPAIQAVQGVDVTLPCYLVPGHGLSAYTRDWTRVDLREVVHACRGNQHLHDAQTDQYRGRTALNCEDWSSGNLTLQIFSVQPSDSGQYRCFIPRLSASCFIDLSVETKDQRNQSKSPESSTTRPPLNELHKPGAANKPVVPIVVAVLVLVLVLVAVLVVRKRETIRAHMKRFRGRREQRAEAVNGTERNHLRTESPKADEDPDCPAADDLGHDVQEV